MTCQKEKNNITQQYIMPWGRYENWENDLECLVREIEEELSCKVDLTSLEFINEYLDVAAWFPDKDVSIRLYKWKIIWNPIPSNEIKYFHWVWAKDINNDNVSPIIRNKIMPDLLEKNILIS